ncbi:MAG TPA: lysylphosphatidylglycerol synthase transmembrane domain-containing protein [Terriglobales bacterium]|nr:lysylphosphatidylglycerol synthase transmembrane domain-containing protein [Terriglobales bacterium]
MNKKRILVFTVVVVVLAVLVYLQVRTWQKFDWHTFGRETSQVDPLRILFALVVIYVTYFLRAVRWKIFLKPVCRAKLKQLVGPQFIGFTGLALLGRPGELIRPYLIAKKENLTVSSQVAVWTVERIFDIGAFTVLMSVDIFFYGSQLPYPPELRKAAWLLIVMVGGMAGTAYLIKRHGPALSSWLQRKLRRLSPKLADSVCNKISAFGEGLNTVHNTWSFVQLVTVSLAIWLLIAVAYEEILHSYPAGAEAAKLHDLQLPHVLLLMGSSMVGSLLQLPAIGGGSQLATISMMSSPHWFQVPNEVAVSAGMLLWLVTFMACVPAGLILARFEHTSLRKLTQESRLEERQEEPVKT